MSNVWIDQIFNCKQARNGGIVRRKLHSVATYASIFELKREVQRRGFHMVISGDQAIVFCHEGDLALAV